MKKITLSVAALLVVSSFAFTQPVFAQAVSATVAAQIQAQIAALQAQLNSQLAQKASVSANASFRRALAIGSRGEDVRQLQIYLGVSPTGYYGVLTAAAVRDLQVSSGLDAVGVVGPKTLAVLNARMAGSAGVSGSGAIQVPPVYNSSSNNSSVTPVTVQPTPPPTNISPAPAPTPTPTPAPAIVATGRIDGQIYIDPNCSSGFCFSSSYAGSLSVKAQASGGAEYSTFTIDSLGNFSFASIPAGNYTVNAFPNNPASLSCTAVTVVVVADQTSTAAVHCK